MKRIVAVILAVIMTLCFASCGEKKSAATLEDKYIAAVQKCIDSGENDKAVELLKQGIEKTKSEKLQQMLDSLGASNTTDVPTTEAPTTAAPTTEAKVLEIEDETSSKTHYYNGDVYYPIKNNYIRPKIKGESSDIAELNKTIEAEYNSMIGDYDERYSYDIKYKKVSYNGICQLIVTNDYFVYATSDSGRKYSIIMFDETTAEVLTVNEVIKRLNLDGPKLVEKAKEEYDAVTSEENRYPDDTYNPSSVTSLKLFFEDDSVKCLIGYFGDVGGGFVEIVDIGKVSDFKKSE